MLHETGKLETVSHHLFMFCECSNTQNGSVVWSVAVVLSPILTNERQRMNCWNTTSCWSEYSQPQQAPGGPSRLQAAPVGPSLSLVQAPVDQVHFSIVVLHSWMVAADGVDAVECVLCVYGLVHSCTICVPVYIHVLYVHLYTHVLCMCTCTLMYCVYTCVCTHVHSCTVYVHLYTHILCMCTCTLTTVYVHLYTHVQGIVCVGCTLVCTGHNTTQQQWSLTRTAIQNTAHCVMFYNVNLVMYSIVGENSAIFMCEELYLHSLLGSYWQEHVEHSYLMLHLLMGL